MLFCFLCFKLQGEVVVFFFRNLQRPKQGPLGLRREKESKEPGEEGGKGKGLLGGELAVLSPYPMRFIQDVS